MRFLRISYFPRLMLLILLGAAQFTFAQFNSSVQGTVQDTSGAVVASATVTLHNNQTNVDYQAKTTSAGFYSFNAVAPGTYKVTVASSGFASKSVDIVVTTDQNAGVNVTLAPGSAATTVQVTSQQAAINPDETRIQSTIEAKQIQAMPLQNGSIFNVVKAAPGVTGIDEDRDLSAVAINGSYMLAAANGRTADANLYMMDGASIMTNSLTQGGIDSRSVQITPNADMVQEVAVETTTFAVDNGAGSSMRINITTKSGTNALHGDVDYRFYTRGMAAVPDFTSANAPFARRWWLTSVGGPIIKDRTFFFFSYLHQYESSSSSALENYTSSQFTSWAAQNYPNSLDVNDMMVPFPADSLQLENVAVTAGSVYPANGSGVCSIPDHTVVGGPQTGATVIPCNLPLLDQGVFTQSPLVNGYQIDARVDQYFRQGKDRIYLSWMKVPQVSSFIWWHSGYNTTTPGVGRYANLNYTHIFTPQLLSQTAFTYQRYGDTFEPSRAMTIPFLTLILGPGASNPGTDWFGTPGSNNSKEHDYVLRSDLTWVHHNHNFKFGGQAGHIDYWDNTASLSSRPSSVIFATWGDYFNDLPTSYSLTTLSAKTGAYQPQVAASQTKQFSLYAQDDWRITPNFLLTAGIRWDDLGNPYVYGQQALPFAQVFPGTGASFSEQMSNAYVKQVSNAFASRQNKNFLPRVGFAWTPGGNRLMKVHGGIGFYEDMLNLYNITGSLPTQPPVDLGLSLNVTNPAPLNEVSAANLYGTNLSGPPYGYTYPTITPQGFDSRGGVIRGVNPVTGATELYPASLSGTDDNLRPQKTTLFNLGIERQLPGTIVADATYSGAYSWDMRYSGDYNTFPGDMITNHGVQERLTPEWGAINFIRNGMVSNYNALIVTARQTKGRLFWQAGYVWSKSLDDPIVENSNETIPDPYNFHNLYGPSDHDVPHSANGSISYELPFPSQRYLTQALLGGWRVSGFTTMQAGTPYSVYTTQSFQYFNSGVNETDPRSTGSYLANGINYSLTDVPNGTKRRGFSRGQYKAGIFPGYTGTSDPPTGQSYFLNPVGYGTAPVQSNQGRNTFRGPGYRDIDAALHKDTKLPWFGSESSNLMLGLEANNVENRVNLEAPGFNITGGTAFAVSKAVYQARVIQLVARFSF